jgi:hypothetical protein
MSSSIKTLGAHKALPKAPNEFLVPHLSLALTNYRQCVRLLPSLSMYRPLLKRFFIQSPAWQYLPNVPTLPFDGLSNLALKIRWSRHIRS